MAMEAIGNVGSISAQQIPDIRQVDRPNGSTEGAEKQENTSTGAPKQSAPAPKADDLAVSTNSNVPTRQERTEEQIAAENERVKKAISEMSKKMFNNSEAVFGIHEDTNRITIKIVDKTTKETIKELPPEKTLDMIAKAWELAGLMVDERG